MNGSVFNFSRSMRASGISATTRVLTRAGWKEKPKKSGGEIDEFIAKTKKFSDDKKSKEKSDNGV